MESSIGRGGFGGSLGALTSEAVENERDIVALASQRDVEESILFFLGKTWEDLRVQVMVLTRMGEHL